MENGPTTFIGFDRKEKTYNELTKEELEDLKQNKERIIENLSNLMKHKNRTNEELEK